MLSKNVQKYKVSVAQVVCVQYLLGPGQLPRSTTGPSPFSDDVSAQVSSSSQVFQHAVSHHLFFFLSPLVYFRFPPLTMPVDPDHSVNIVASDPENRDPEQKQDEAVISHLSSFCSRRPLYHLPGLLHHPSLCCRKYWHRRMP